MKAKTLKLIEKLARDVRRGDELCDYNPVFMELFGSLFLEPHDFWMKRDPFEGIVYNPHQSDEE